MNFTVFDVDGENDAGSVGVKTAVTECLPTPKLPNGPMTTPLTTGNEPPSGMSSAKSRTVPAALGGVTIAMGITKPPIWKGSGTRITDNLVTVFTAPGAGVGAGVTCTKNFRVPELNCGSNGETRRDGAVKYLPQLGYRQVSVNVAGVQCRVGNRVGPERDVGQVISGVVRVVVTGGTGELQAVCIREPIRGREIERQPPGLPQTPI